jgi:hypothetical protein
LIGRHSVQKGFKTQPLAPAFGIHDQRLQV